jgi:hypothetical protein
MLLAGGVEPGIIEEILGAAKAGAIGEEEKFCGKASTAYLCRKPKWCRRRPPCANS